MKGLFFSLFIVHDSFFFSQKFPLNFLTRVLPKLAMEDHQGSDLSVGWRKNLPGVLNPFGCQQALTLEFRLTPQVLDSERSSFFPPGHVRGVKK